MRFKNNKKPFPLCPEGSQQLVCCDIVDLGMKMNDRYGKEEAKVRIVWETADVDPETNKPYQVSGQYTNTLHEKSRLRKDLEAWLGRKLTRDEVEGEGFDPEANLIGLNGFAGIVHNTAGNGNVYANVQSLMPLPRGMAKIAVSKTYVRAKDRPKKNEQQDSDDNVPF